MGYGETLSQKKKINQVRSTFEDGQGENLGEEHCSYVFLLVFWFVLVICIEED